MPDRSAFLPAIVAGRINAAPFHADDGFAAEAQDSKLHVVAAVYKSLPNWWYGSLAVTDKYRTANRATITKFIKAMIQADRWIYTHAAQTIAIGVKETQESKSAVSKAYVFLKKANEWTVNDGLEKGRVMNTMRYEHKLKQIPRVPTYNEVTDLSITNGILKQLGRWKTGY
jgi:ABC-type nitrate/sulfonate/bicarbonate transport system substrate-binding protein